MSIALMAGFTENTYDTVWIALKRLDLNESRATALREVHMPSDANVATVTQILAHSFRLDESQTTFKIRNSHGCLIPLNCRMPANSKQMPYVLEVAKNFQNVNPRPRSIPMNVINKTIKPQLQSILKRIERLEDLLPKVKQKHHEKISTDIEFLNQKLLFLHKRMQTAESYCWEGMLRRAPLW
ncbi:uncharacterized protein si:zfos-1056e6.1 isoform X1 [Triplophysa dalaica]|uniref:uncharacterized protein si:zfos-1056e6.1 isoform X1 n=1 Tax=Triplophysa dalaica TaxID=1582913 RepID=UPI0024E01B25|nr:uncharacterized protein si:zfos-1056e6.1 isoform X1 [Triplophysa dalaica]